MRIAKQYFYLLIDLQQRTNMDGFTEGRIVHFVMPNGDHRPAIIVNTWRHLNAPGIGDAGVCDGYANLSVFTDHHNDVIMNDSFNPEEKADIERGLLWRTSVCYSEDNVPGTWHWIEKA